MLVLVMFPWEEMSWTWNITIERDILDAQLVAGSIMLGFAGLGDCIVCIEMVIMVYLHYNDNIITLYSQPL